MIMSEKFIIVYEILWVCVCVRQIHTNSSQSLSLGTVGLLACSCVRSFCSFFLVKCRDGKINDAIHIFTKTTTKMQTRDGNLYDVVTSRWIKCHGMRVKVRLWIICYLLLGCACVCALFLLKRNSESSLECDARWSHCSSLASMAHSRRYIGTPIIDLLVVWQLMAFCQLTHIGKHRPNRSTNYWTAQYRFNIV